jgi:hypothetical protein
LTDDRRVLLLDTHPLGAAEHVEGHVFELDAEVFGDHLTTGQGGDVLEHSLAPIAEARRLDRGSTIVTSNLPFDEWTGVFGSERLTGALLDRLTHHVHILELNGDSYRLKQSKRRHRQPPAAEPSDN